MIARKAGPRALERAVELVEAKDETVALRAAALVLDRAYGRAALPLVGDDEAPAEPNLLEVARRLAFVLAGADHSLSLAKGRDDDAS